jgi:TonB-dependent receptor
MLFRRFALVTLVLTWSATAFAQTPTGRVTGRVLDAMQGLPMPGAAVQVVGLPAVTHTDVDGRFVVTAPVGRQQIKITFPDWAERTIDVVVTPTGLDDVAVSIAPAGFTETITVQGQSIDAETSSLAAQLLERRRANTIQDNLGSQEMKANADSNAAAALQRVTGLSMVGDSYAFVRGLGERYSNTTLNGATLPSTEPERKVVSLDMFPAGLLDSVSVVKSYTPDRSAEFAGGLVEIVPSKLPVSPLLNLSYKFGGNSQTWGEDVLDHGSGDADWLGLPNSSRSLPADIPGKRVTRGGIYTPEIGVSQSELERLGEAFVNEWTPSTTTGRASQGFSVSLGSRWDKLGVSGGVNHSYDQHSQDEAQTYYRTQSGGTLTPFSEYDYRMGSSTGALAILANAGYAAGTNHQVSTQVFSTDKGRRETRTFEGFNSDAGFNLRNSRLLWQEESLRSVQVAGDHFLQTMSNSRLQWRGTYSRSNRDEPDLREVLYQEIDDEFLLADESQSGFRQFNDLDEASWDFAVNWSLVFGGPSGLPAMLKVGPYVSHRDRDFASRRFRFVPIDVVRFDLTPSPEELFTPENIGTHFELREETRTTDFYGAEQRITAGYAMLDLSLSQRTRLIAGVRVERFRQTVDTFDLFDTDFDETVQTVRGEIEETDVFPAVNIVQDLGRNQNLRLGFSQTVNRPEFRELTPFEFTDIVGGRAVIGNPDLQRSLIQNVDVRWEWFPSGSEVVAASVFYKRFDQPIERFVEPTAQLRTSYTNADSARNLGIEIEGRRRLGAHVTLGANYTFVDSSITLAASQTNVLTSLERPLSGTSKHLFNGMVEVAGSAVSARFLVNYFGARIVDVGSLGLPDILEEGRPTVDAVVSARLSPRFNVRFQAENLGDQEVRFLQGGQPQRIYTVGRTFMVSFGFTGF